MKPQTLHDSIIFPVLEHMEKELGKPFNTSAARQLLVVTAGQESHCGSYFKQIKGPALGIYQVEPATENDLFDNYLLYHDKFRAMLYSFRSEASRTNPELKASLGNTFYTTAAARFQYYRQPMALPKLNDFDGMWQYYKKYWNTELGAATKEEFKVNWTAFAMRVNYSDPSTR